jgi:hypothetical protein
MAIAPEEGITPAEARAATSAARKAADAQNAAEAQAAQNANIAESDARLRARIPSSPSVPVVPVIENKTGGNSAGSNVPGSKTSGTSGASTQGVAGIDPSVQAYINAMNAKQAAADAATAASAQAERVSAFNILKEQFSQYGLGSLVDGIKNLLTDGTPSSEFALRLRQTPEYKARFAANDVRINAGLAALSPAEYVALEDQYQNIMRNYGLPSSYYTKDTTGKQVGFEKLLGADVSASELEDRVATAQKRVLNTNPEVLQALRQFYPDLGNADILAYTLDPQNALANIKRKVTAAEIGGAALAQGLQAQGGTAESLAGMGITKAQAQQGYTEIAGVLPRASQLSDIYGQGPYTQATAEAETFNTAGSAAATAKRKKLASLEIAAFSGQSGVGALGRDKSLYGQSYGQQGQY